MGVEDLEGLKKRQMIRSMIDSNRLLVDIGTEDFESVESETPLYDVIAKMRSADLHEIPVVDSGTFAGVVSFGSLLKRKNLPVNTKAKSISENPPRITMETPVTQVAEHLVSTGYRQIPVLNGKKVVGTVSRTDIISIIPKVRDLRDIKVSEIMSEDVKVVSGKDPLQTAIDIMGRLDIRTLPVLDEFGRVKGMVGVKDIVNYNWRERTRATVGEIAGQSIPVEIKVESLSVDNPITVDPDTTLQEAVDLILDNRISTLPVIDEDGLRGVVTTYDLVELVASFKEREMVYVQITGLEEEDRYSLDVMEREIQNGLAKISKISKPMLFILHVSKYHQEGNTSKYSLSGRLTTEHRLYVAKAHDWNLIRATIELMERLEGMVIERKEEMIDLKKRRK